MLMSYLIFILFLGLLFLAIYRSSFFKIEDWSRKPIFLAFGYKLVAAFFLVFIYTYYYTDRSVADIYRYFDDAAYLFENTRSQLAIRWDLILGIQSPNDYKTLIAGTQNWDSSQEFFFNDNRTMIRIHLLLYHFSNGFFQLHNLFFVFLSFVGSFGIFRFFQQNSTLPISLIFVLSFFIPSFVFWTSAPLKESFLIFGIGVLLFGLLSFSKKKWIQGIFLMSMALFCLLSLKVYILIALFPALLFFLFTHRLKGIVVRFLSVHFIALVIAFFFIDDIVNVLQIKQSAFKELAIAGQAKSTIPLHNLSSSMELLQTIPQGIFNVLFRPIWPPNWNPFSLLASMEHLLYLLILLASILFYKKPKPKELRVALFCISFVLISSIIIGLTTPILGSIVRYKTPFLPFYLLLLFTFTDFVKLKNRLPFL